MSASSGATPGQPFHARVPNWVLATIAIVMALLGLLSSPAGATLQDAIEQRAAVTIEADFAKPLDGWYGDGNWTRGWMQERSAVRVGRLMLHRPSVRLANYDFEFAGQIARRSLGWVFRAADLRNYYAARLIAPDAPGSPLVLERSVVIGGEVLTRVHIPIRERLDLEKPLRIEVQVRGSDFRTSIEGRVVDFFRDDLLQSGGVGFMGEPEDRPRIYWMRVRHQDDALGRVCAWISGIS